MAKKVEKKTYLLETSDGRKKVTVPASWKLTFGPLAPGSKDGSLNSRGATALRFYEGNKDNQRAVFTDVQSFRDMSIEIEVEVSKSSEHAAQVKTPAGVKDVIMRGEVKQWQNPDKPQKDADFSLVRLEDKSMGMSAHMGEQRAQEV